MPTNPNSPFGFKFVTNIDGSPPNYGLRPGKIASANTNKVFRGDVLKPYASGYLDVWTGAANTAVGGVAWAFEWVSKSQNKTVRQNWWPGNGDATGDVTVYYYAGPTNMFEVQCTTGPIQQASVGLNANFAVGSGGTQTGAGNQSSFTLDDSTLATTTTLPFKVYRLPVDSNGPQSTMLYTAGYDPTNTFNRVYVTFQSLIS